MVNCQRCAAEGFNNVRLTPLYAIPEEKVKTVHPFSNAMEVLADILDRKSTLVWDAAYCARKHGIVKV